MKKLIVVLSFVFGIYGAFAQVKTIRHPSGYILAFECSNGDIKNASVQPKCIIQDTLGVVDTVLIENAEDVNPYASVLVYMSDSLTITDPNGYVLAQYDPDDRTLKDHAGFTLFTIDNSDQIFNAAGAVLGWRDEDGNFFGSDSNMLAIAPDITLFKLGYFFFYSNR